MFGVRAHVSNFSDSGPHAKQTALLFDYLVGAGEQCCRHCHAKHAGLDRDCGHIHRDGGMPCGEMVLVRRA
jgi:hypothetical protein